MWEFETTYPKLQHVGLLVSDDAFWNNSFYDFARKACASEAQILRGVGFLRKNSVSGFKANTQIDRIALST